MKNRQSGQVLLITVMLVATVITVVMTLVFKTNIDTQTTKLQEDSQKALAAAQAGIERGLQGQYGAFNNLGLNNLSGINMTDSTVSNDEEASQEFVTPLIKKDEQYTFYLTGWDTANNVFGATGPTATQSIDIYYGSNSVACNDVNLELTLISGNAPYTLTRFVANTDTSYGGSQIGINTGGSLTYKNVATVFNCKTSSITIPVNPKLLIIRVLSSSGIQTKLGLKFNSEPYIIQGNLNTSTAKTNTGVVKTIRLFQSYPQIPADFFVTSF